MISEISTLTYLDDRPVFSLERVCAEAFANGGIKAERQARIDYKMLEDAKLSMNHSTLLNMRENATVKRRIVSKQGKKAFQNAGFDIRNLNQAYEIDLEPPRLTLARSNLVRCHATCGI
jgi:dynein assembly factor 1|tara:strand:+ start:891 stop:1247 length:357 start_codon:yes stop_codon:yes gene_type:complete